MAVSESKMKANHKWDAENYDTLMVRLPKGSRELIERSNETYNSFMNKAFKEYCESHGIIKE